jgi:hypothetical protein
MDLAKQANLSFSTQKIYWISLATVVKACEMPPSPDMSKVAAFFEAKSNLDPPSHDTTTAEEVTSWTKLMPPILATTTWLTFFAGTEISGRRTTPVAQLCGFRHPSFHRSDDVVVTQSHAL